MLLLRDMLRWFNGGDAKAKPAFETEKQAYDFSRQLYNKSGGVAPELRRSYEFYLKNINDECGDFVGPQEHHPSVPNRKKGASIVSMR